VLAEVSSIRKDRRTLRFIPVHASKRVVLGGRTQARADVCDEEETDLDEQGQASE
jgi:hypothetical protein